MAECVPICEGGRREAGANLTSVRISAAAPDESGWQRTSKLAAEVLRVLRCRGLEVGESGKVKVGVL